MSLGESCAKALLIIFNSILGIIGLLMFAGGITLYVRSDLLLSNPLTEPYTQPVINQFYQLLNIQTPSSGNGTTATPTNPDLTFLTQPIGIVLIVIGGAIALVSLLGAFGACCNNKFLLIVYSVIMGLIICAQIAVVIAFFVGGFNSIIQQLLKMSINNYVDIDDLHPDSVTWNLVMTHFNCCGITNYLDFNPNGTWAHRSTSFLGIVVNVKLVTPVACCKFTSSYQPVDTSCALTPTNFTSNYLTGCYGVVTSWLNGLNIQTTAIGVISGVIALQVILLIFAIVIYHHLKTQKKSAAKKQPTFASY